VLESKFPIQVERYALNVDSGGPGRQRGGLGVIKDCVPLTEGIALSLWFERSRLPAWGLFGGGSGRAPVVIMDPNTPDERRLWKVNHLSLHPGMRISARTGGGGGYGPPWEREVQRVLDDLIDGYITRGAAESIYGLRFHDGSYEVDEAATDRARSQLSSTKAIRNSQLSRGGNPKCDAWQY